MHLVNRAICLRGRAWVWQWLMVLLQLGAVCAHAQNGAIMIGSQSSYVLSRSFTMLDDPSAALTLNDILQTDTLARFKPVGQGAASTNFGSTNSAVWLRVELQSGPGTPAHWLLEVDNPPLDQVDVYLSNVRGGYDHQAGGDSLPFTDRVIPHRNQVKPVDISPGTSSTLFLRVASQGTVSAPVTLWQPAALWQHDQRSYSIFSLYFGLLVGLLVYNLLLFLSVRDHAYLIYVFFVAFIGLSQAANSGLGAQYLWPQATWWNNNSINVAYCASGTFGVMFARSFLASRRKMPTLDRWMRVLMALWVAAIFTALFLPYKVASSTETWLALITVLTVVLAGGESIRRRHPGAQYFAYAWAALLTGVLTQTLHNYGLLPSNPFTANAILIGSALEMVLLSFALADRINVVRREKEMAQAQIVSEQAMVHALRQSQQHYLAVIEHLGEGMVVVQDQRIVFVNARATEILETSKEMIVAEGMAHRLQPDDRAAMGERARRRLARLDVPERCQVRLERAGKPVKWLECGETLVPWDGGQGLLIFFLDVTQRHQAEQDIRTTLDRQQELNDLRSRFVAMTSHEFRTPLASILSSQDLLKHYSDRLPENEKLELLAIIESGVHRMTRMLDRVLLLGKAEAHMLEFKPRLIDLKALCNDLVLEARNQQPNNNCQLVFDFAARFDTGWFDDKLLRHIFSNLLSNAIKYSPDGGAVRIRVFTQASETVFEVSDQGIGIPAEEIGHLFESFHRASNVGDIHGTGLGLAIVKNAVDLHGGTIQVTDNDGQGTRFTVRLRVSQTTPASGPDLQY